MLSYAMLQLQGRSHVGILPRGVSRVGVPARSLPREVSRALSRGVPCVCGGLHAGNLPASSSVHLHNADSNAYFPYVLKLPCVLSSITVTTSNTKANFFLKFELNLNSGKMRFSHKLRRQAQEQFACGAALPHALEIPCAVALHFRNPRGALPRTRRSCQ